MEPVRPLVDRFVLDLVDTCVLERGDVIETRAGVCRLGTRLTYEASTAAEILRAGVVDVAKFVRARLISASAPSPRASGHG
jgi:hypothetical protein